MADERDLTDFPRTANERYLDSALRHQVGLARATSGESRRVLEELEAADRELSRWLRTQLPKQTPAATKRFRRMLDGALKRRRATHKAFRKLVRSDLFEVARMEADFERRLLQAVLPKGTKLVPAGAGALRRAVTSTQMRGRVLREWFTSWERADLRRLKDELVIGVQEGARTNAIMAEIAGTRADGFTQGALATTRRQADAVIRTTVDGVANAAREELWLENPDLIRGLVWTSVLDEKTTAVCRARDGRVAPIANKPLPSGVKRLIPPGARPPAHVRCRSVMTAWLVGGPQPRKLDYGQWLTQQSTTFQDGVLGQTKARLWRKGKMRLTGFVDTAGNELTLAQLADKRPDVFRKAGLSPADF